MRWLIALISDTGMRLGEAAGLLKEDIKLDDHIPHIFLKPHRWKSLKIKDSNNTNTFDQKSFFGLLEASNDSICAFSHLTAVRQVEKSTMPVVD